MGNEISTPGERAKLPLHVQKAIDVQLKAFQDMQVMKDKQIMECKQSIQKLKADLRDERTKVGELEDMLKHVEEENKSIKISVTSAKDSEDSLYKGLAMLYLSKNSEFAMKNERKENEKLKKRFEDLKDLQESSFKDKEKNVLTLLDDLKNSEKKYSVFCQRKNYNSLQVCGDLTQYLDRISKELIPFQEVESHFRFIKSSFKELNDFSTFISNHKKVVSLHENFKREIANFGKFSQDDDNLSSSVRGRLITSNETSSDSEDTDEEDEGESESEEPKPLVHQLEEYLRSNERYCHSQNIFSDKFDSAAERITSLYKEINTIVHSQQDMISSHQVTDFYYARHLNSVFYRSEVPKITEEYNEIKKSFRSIDEFLSRLSKFESSLKKRFLDVQTEVQSLLLLEEEKFQYLKKIEDNFLEGSPNAKLIPTELIKEVKKRFSGLFSLIRKSKFQERIRSNVSFDEKDLGTQFCEEKYKNLTNCKTWIHLTKLFCSLVSDFLHGEYEKMVTSVELALENNYISFGKSQIASVIKGKSKKVTYYGTVKILRKEDGILLFTSSSLKKGSMKMKKDSVVVPHGIGREYYKKNQVFVGTYEDGCRRGKGIDYYAVPHKIGVFEYFADSKYMKYTPLEEPFGDNNIQEFITSETKKVLQRRKEVKKNNTSGKGSLGNTFKLKKKEEEEVDAESINQSLKEKLDEEKKKLEQMKERLECKICFENESNAILYPCGHSVCEKCGEKLDICPFCRKYVDKVVKHFL